MFKDKKLIIIIFSIVLFIGGIIYFGVNSLDNETDTLYLTTTKEVTEKKRKEKQYIDIKGSVNNPGVYEFKNNDRVIDAIEYAGGLTKFANTSNINLSQKLTSEMVIYVFSNNEIKNGSKNTSCSTICEPSVIEVNNCVNDEKSGDKVNINTATKDELMTLTGIGESKANNIIAYRETNGAFKVIEDIKKISGIGDALFEKIKDSITV